MQRAGRSPLNHSSKANQEPTSKRAAVLPPGLYIVGTPIGNLGDITYRAVDILARADVIACEDRRVTAKLLAAYHINTPSVSYHDHNAARIRPKLIERLQKGESVALVSDAGTPLIADPGFKLVQACVGQGIAVVPIPGANAAVTALTAAALPSDTFRFCGFLPNKTAARRRDVAKLAAGDATLVFYESPRRLAATLRDLADILGNRPAVVAREMTKVHEEFVRDELEALADHYADATPPKGEVVVLVGPPLSRAKPTDDKVDALLVEALETMSVRDAADQVSATADLPRRQVYARAVRLKAIERT